MTEHIIRAEFTTWSEIRLMPSCGTVLEDEVVQNGYTTSDYVCDCGETFKSRIHAENHVIEVQEE